MACFAIGQLLFLVLQGTHAFVPKLSLSTATQSSSNAALYMQQQQPQQMESGGMIGRRSLLSGIFTTTTAAAVSSLAVVTFTTTDADRARAAVLKSRSGYDLTPMTKEEVLEATKDFTELQQKVLLQAGTERSFTGTTVNGYTHDTKANGTWVSAVSGVPLFSSDAKYDSGTGWPSFYAVIDKDHVIERADPRDEATLPPFLRRVEVLDRKSGTHLGHVFPDGPPPTGKRYCMNAASMKFIPAE